MQKTTLNIVGTATTHAAPNPKPYAYAAPNPKPQNDQMSCLLKPGAERTHGSPNPQAIAHKTKLNPKRPDALPNKTRRRDNPWLTEPSPLCVETQS